MPSPRNRRPGARGQATPPERRGPVVPPRIIGGEFRGRKLHYSGDARTRPMKDRVREAVFNLLGGRLDGWFALDLFAGTGALGIEALSRGATGALLLELHAPAVRLVRQTLAEFRLEDRAQVVQCDTLHWFAMQRPEQAAWYRQPRLVFCSPPWEMFAERGPEVVALLRLLASTAPGGARLVVEADERFDFSSMPEAAWDIRQYKPARIGLADFPAWT